MSFVNAHFQKVPMLIRFPPYLIETCHLEKTFLDFYSSAKIKFPIEFLIKLHWPSLWRLGCVTCSAEDKSVNITDIINSNEGINCTDELSSSSSGNKTIQLCQQNCTKLLRNWEGCNRMVKPQSYNQKIFLQHDVLQIPRLWNSLVHCCTLSPGTLFTVLHTPVVSSLPGPVQQPVSCLSWPAGWACYANQTSTIEPHYGK